MKVSTKTIFFGIYEMLAGMDIKQGGSVNLTTLRRRWPETRLREEDLDKGLKALQASGFLKLERSIFGDEVQLVNDRFGQIVSEEDKRAHAALAVLRKLRAPIKTAGNPKPGSGRRPGDVRP
ncbi:MAG: hypothetical protein K0Q76_1426 [Panacagrimonas sp.]|jgi:hypothetical protein|nr:hypothetical protein [Panacagrimonas sp.]MCC2656318.1 hypothetical protein [Panacagrimonas sp.]